MGNVFDSFENARLSIALAWGKNKVTVPVREQYVKDVMWLLRNRGYVVSLTGDRVSGGRVIEISGKEQHA